MAEPTLTIQNESSDRLSFTVFVAIAVHALLIFGISYSVDKSSNVAPTFNVTLATHKDKDAPEQADFLAQHNQQASGTEDTAKELLTTELSKIADTQINEVNPAPERRKVLASEDQRQVIKTRVNEQFQTIETPDITNNAMKIEQDGGEIEAPELSPEAAALQAKLDRDRQALARQPRIRRLTSVATKASEDAEYLNKWTQKIELIGNEHFPREAVSQGLIGSLTMVVTLLPDGSIDDATVTRSSGHSILDDAALQTVRLAAPFAPFPKNMRLEADKLEIIRTWRFDITGLSTSR